MSSDDKRAAALSGLLARLGFGIKVQAQLNPVLEVLLQVDADRVNEQKALHHFSGKIHAASTLLFQRFVVKLRIDTNHERVLDYADRHFVFDHHAKATHHLFRLERYSFFL